MWCLIAVWIAIGISALVVARFWHGMDISLKNVLLYASAGPVLIIYFLLLLGCFLYTEWYLGDRSHLLGLAHHEE